MEGMSPNSHTRGPTHNAPSEDSRSIYLYPITFQVSTTLWERSETNPLAAVQCDQEMLSSHFNTDKLWHNGMLELSAGCPRQQCPRSARNKEYG